MSTAKNDFWGLRLGSSKFAYCSLAAIKPEWDNLSVYATGTIPKGVPMKFGIIGPQPAGAERFVTIYCGFKGRC